MEGVRQERRKVRSHIELDLGPLSISFQCGALALGPISEPQFLRPWSEN